MLAILILAASVTSRAVAQEWQFIGAPLTSAAISDAGTMLVVGERGIIMRSESEQNEWTLPFSSTYHTLRAVRFFSEGVAVVVGDDGTILRSKDAGQEWSQIDYAFDGDLSLLHVVDQAVGFAYGGGFLHSTVDAGVTWQAITTLPSEAIDLYLTTSTSGYYVDTAGVIWSIDVIAGTVNEAYSESGARFTALDFSDDGDTGFAATSEGWVYRSTDGGVEWRRLTVDAGIDVADIEMTSSGRVVAVGSDLGGPIDSVMVVSDDLGESWSKLSISSRYAFYRMLSVSLRVDGQGVSVSNTGSVIRWRGGGDSLEVVSDPNAVRPPVGAALFRRGTFPTASVGLLANSAVPGGYIRTTDGGITWITQTFGTSTKAGFHLFDSLRGLMFDEQTKDVFHTFDGGLSWIYDRAELQPDRRDRTVDVGWSETAGWMTAVNGVAPFVSLVYRSADSARSFVGTTFDTGWVWSSQFFYSDSIMVAGLYRQSVHPDSARDGWMEGRILRTTDAGTSWRLLWEEEGRYVWPLSIAMRDTSRIYFFLPDHFYTDLADAPGFLMESLDGGRQWSMKERFDQTVADIAFFNDSHWLAVGTNASLWESRDGGDTWLKEVFDPQPGYHILSVPDGITTRLSSFHNIHLFPDDRTVFVTGTGALLRKAYDEPLSTVEEGAPRLLHLNLQIAPNPASNEVRVSWNRLIDGTLSVYDASGRRVLHRRIDDLSSMRFDTRALSPGTYFLQIGNGEHGIVATARFIMAQ